MTQTIEKPSYYNMGSIECFDAIQAAVIGKSPYSAFLVGNVFKYIWRYDKKNGLEDLLKARRYLNKLIEEEYGNEQK